MTLNQLNYFLTVCQCGNMTRAAAMLRVSQPAVTDAIKELEKEYQASLFTRHKTFLSLTPAGQALYDSATEVMEAVEQMNSRMSEIRCEKARINAGLTAGCYSLFRELFPSYYEAHPDVEINVFTYANGELEQALARGLLDVAVGAPMEGREVVSQPLVNTASCLWVHEASPLACKKRIDVSADLAGVRMAVFAEDLFSVPSQKLMPGLISLNVVFRTNQLGEIREFLLDQEGAAVLEQHVFRGTPQLRAIPLKQPMKNQISISWRQTAVPDYVMSFIAYTSEFIKEHFARL